MNTKIIVGVSLILVGIVLLMIGLYFLSGSGLSTPDNETTPTDTTNPSDNTNPSKTTVPAKTTTTVLLPDDPKSSPPVVENGPCSLQDNISLDGLINHNCPAACDTAYHMWKILPDSERQARNIDNVLAAATKAKCTQDFRKTFCEGKTGIDALINWGCDYPETCQSAFNEWKSWNGDQMQAYGVDKIMAAASKAKCTQGFNQAFCDKKSGLDALLNWNCKDPSTCERAYSEWAAISADQKQNLGIDRVIAATQNAKCNQDFLSEFCLSKEPLDAIENWGCKGPQICLRLYANWTKMTSAQQQPLLDRTLLAADKAGCGAVKDQIMADFCKKKGGLDGLVNWGCKDAETCRRAAIEWSVAIPQVKALYGGLTNVRNRAAQFGCNAAFN